jgi:5-methylcytosine-specific restriction protein A
VARRPCLTCARLTSNPSRCDVHAAEYAKQRDRQRGSAHSRGYTQQYRVLARQVLSEYRASNGERCPGWQVPPHGSADLTVDHVIPLARGGTHDRSNLAVLCRRCNSRKRDAL